MTDASDYLENALLDHVFRNTALTSPTTVYLALYTAAPSDSGGGTEVSGGGYARQSVTFGAAASGTISNTADVSFTPSGANYGTVTNWGIFDASTGGNLLVHGSFSPSIVLNDGDTHTFSSGDIDITLD